MDCRGRVVDDLIIEESCNLVPLGEAFNQAFFGFIRPPLQVASDTRVKDGVGFVGHDVDVVLPSRRMDLSEIASGLSPLAMT